MRPCSILLLLLAPAAAGGGEKWADLEKEWFTVLRRYEAAKAKSPSRRIRHPFPRYHERLLAFARAHANSPAAAPALVEIIRFTKDPDEQHWVLLHLRENHLRSRHIGRAVDAIRRSGHEEALLTLREFSRGSPYPEIRGRARRAVRELTQLGIGMTAPQIAGRDHDDEVFVLREYRGKVVVLFFCMSGSAGCVREIDALKGTARRYSERPFAILGVGPKEKEWRSWDDANRIARNWNALETPRIFLIDRSGVIQAKDLWGRDLEKAVQRLLSQSK